MINDETACPCGSSQLFSECCKPIISGSVSAQTPEQLMRSRYSAYSQKNVDYILKSMRGKAAAQADRASIQAWAAQCAWQGLTVLKAEQASESEGYVEFVARYIEAGQAKTLQERSRFIRDGDDWFYVDGEPIKPGKIGRNAPCPCGSQRKYKRCCGR